MLNRIKSYLLSVLHSNKHFRWYVDYPYQRKERMRTLSAYYTTNSSAGFYNHCTNEKHVICICDDKLKMGGITDRLRGIISTYMACKELGLPLSIYFNEPFRLEDYLQPASFDWHIESKDISYVSEVAEPLCLEVTDNTIYQQHRMHQQMKKEITSARSCQLHIYTDSHACYIGNNYGRLFHELFKPAPSLQQHIDSIKAFIGKPYVSVSTRFQQLLNDFTDCSGEILGETERRKLIAKVTHQLEQLHDTLPADYAILCLSDSTSFLKEVEALPYVHTVPGDIVHTDYCDKPSSDAIEKVFLDMLLIADAEEVFLLQTGKMYGSGFPYAASQINGKAFHHIKF